MTRIFWDSMLFTYLFQKDPTYWERVASLRRQSLERGDEICTSHLALGEIMAGAYRDKDETAAKAIRDGMKKQVSDLSRSICNRWNFLHRFVRSIELRRQIQFILPARRALESTSSSPRTRNSKS